MGSMRKLRISAISYLNTAPLMWDFEHADAARDFEISYTLPALCAQELRQGSADIGIVPVAAYASIPDLLILPGVAIAALSSVRSSLLVSPAPQAEIRSVALAPSSLTSVALTRVLFEKFWGGGRSFAAMKPDLEQMLSHHDAALIIGDPALQVDRSRYFTQDLAEEWNRATGHPFVFAFWTVRRTAASEADPALNLGGVFQQSRDHGLRPESLREISESWAPRLGLSRQDVRRYLTENIHYHLDARCIAGLRLFYRLAEECGALPKAPELQFAESARPVLR